MVLFIDENSRIDKESLRQYALGELTRLEQTAEKLVTGERYHGFWEGLHAVIGLEYKDREKERLLAVESQLKNLNNFVRTWISTAVESSEAFEFFIQTKATEIRSGDEKKDYFWALQIRHDQLIALVGVTTEIIKLMEEWVAKQPSEVVKDEKFVEMTKRNVEQRVYYEAEEIQHKREEMAR